MIFKNNLTSILFIRFFVIPIFLLSIHTTIYAQNEELEFNHITAEDGLSLSSTTKVIQDKKGFLWIGTYNGLNRYDGYEFKTFLPQTNNQNGISNHSIWTLFEDSKGYVWVGTLDGLNKFDWETEKFTVYKNDPSNPNSLSNNYVLSIYEDKAGTLWIGTLNGLNKFNRKKNNFSVIKKVSDRLNPDSLNSVLSIVEDNNKLLWISTWNGLTHMNRDGLITETLYSQKPDSKYFDYRMFPVVYKDYDNNIWLGTNGNGLKKYNPKTKEFQSFVSIQNNKNTISNNFINAIYQDNNKNLWIGTRDGFNKYNSSSNTFTRYVHNPQKPLSIIHNDIRGIAEDKTGIIWVSTAAGLCRFYISKNKFNFYSENTINPQKGLSSNRTSAIFIDKNENIWVGTFNGLNQIVAGSNNIIKYFNNPGKPNSLIHNNIMSVYKDHLGAVWIGTNHTGLNRMDPATGKFDVFQYDISDSNSISNNGITTICEDKNRNLWFGTWWGLNRFDRRSGKFERFLHVPGNPNSIPHDLIWVIFEDSKGMLWIGTDGGGVSEFNTTTRTFRNFNRDSSAEHRLSENRVLTIFESKDGIIWFGTNYGLTSYNRKLDKTKIYSTENGLPGNLINGITEDENGFLWISSDKGLTKFNRQNNLFTNFSKRNGLGTDIEFTQNMTAKSKDGTLYFGCRDGILFFHPDDIKTENFNASLVFTNLKIFNQRVQISKDAGSILNESITGISSVKIPYKSSFITIEFALLDFFNPKRNQFAYKLIGFDEDWNYVGGRNSATYTNLPPGEYTFKVKAFNNIGFEAGLVKSLKITIIPSFYQTWIFRISVLFILSLIVLFVFQMRTRKIKLQNKILEGKVAERTKDLDKTISNLSLEVLERIKAEESVQKSLNEKEILLKEIHHRVKNNLQVISSLLFLQSSSLKDEEAINMFKDSQDRIRCMALIHEKLYQSKDFGGISFYEYVKSLITDLERSYKKRDVTINSIININNISLSLDTAMSCGLIINELITNIFKYAFPIDWVKKQPESFECTINISVEKTNDNQYILEIRDNGIGLPPDFNIQNTDSLGMKLVDSMSNQLNGSVEIINGNGTIFKIYFEDLS